MANKYTRILFKFRVTGECLFHFIDKLKNKNLLTKLDSSRDINQTQTCSYVQDKDKILSFPYNLLIIKYLHFIGEISKSYVSHFQILKPLCFPSNDRAINIHGSWEIFFPPTHGLMPELLLFLFQKNAINMSRDKGQS